jgi:antitoxin ParD1/3/4
MSAARSAKPLTVTLGPLSDMVRERVESGRYASASEVLRAGLRALQREEATLDEILKLKVREALADPRPSVQQDEVFARLDALHREHSGK